MLLTIHESSSEPLHGQISRQIRARILAGRLTAGDALPSIRTLARSHRVSTITIRRAYEDLAREGLVHARQGKGFFVAELTGRKKMALARERLIEALEPVIREAQSQGLSQAQMRAVLDTLLEEKGDERE